MHVDDFKTLKLSMSNNFLSNNMQGTVVKLPEELEKNMYGIYIGRMMLGIPGDKSEGAREEVVSLSSNRCLNSKNKEVGEKSATVSNYIKLTMRAVYNMSMPRLIKGETVDVGIVDQDLKSMFIRPYARDQIKKRPNDILETYVPASGTYDGADMDDTNKYYLRFDSVNKMIRIHMSDAQGEIAKYDIAIDGDTGMISITDGVRIFVMNTNDDEIYMKNEAESTISMKGDTIEILSNKIYVRAKDEMQVETPKFVGKMDNTELTIDKMKAKIDTSEINGTKLTEKYTTADYDNTKMTTKCPASTFDGALVTMTGGIACAGIGFGVPAGAPPSPAFPGVDKGGVAAFNGPASLPLVKHAPLMALLAQIAAKADAAGAALCLPPTAAPAVASMGSSLMSTAVKG